MKGDVGIVGRPHNVIHPDPLPAGDAEGVTDERAVLRRETLAEAVRSALFAGCCVPTRPAESPSVTRGTEGLEISFPSAEKSSREPLPPASYLVGLCGSVEMVTSGVGAE